MALSLKDPETDRLAREVARLTGESLTEAVRTALAERLERERLRRGKPQKGLAERLNKSRCIARRCRISTRARRMRSSATMKTACGDDCRYVGCYRVPARRTRATAVPRGHRGGSGQVDVGRQHVEASMVLLGRKRAGGLSDLQAFLDEGDVQRVAVDVHQAEIAVDAFRRFGRGRHPAALNIGDCFVYALAKATGEKLLFKGNDFARTDVSTVPQD